MSTSLFHLRSLRLPARTTTRNEDIAYWFGERHRQTLPAAGLALPGAPSLLQVDSGNRLVADSLEADWNEKLRSLALAQDVGIVAFEVFFGFSNLFVHGNIRLPASPERFASGIFVLPALHRLQ